MNDYWDYLAHARKAKERDDHKYIERVPIGTNKGKTVYRYFYTEQEYQAYLNKKESEKKSTGANANESLKKVAGEVLKKAADRGTDEEYQGTVFDLYNWYVDPEYKILGQWNGANLHLIEKCMALEGSMPDKENAVQRAKKEYDDAKLNYDTVRKAEGLVGLLTKSETMLKAEAELKAASEKYQEAKAALEEAEAAYDKVRKDDDFARQLTAYNNLVSGNADSSAGLINEYYTIEQELKMYPANSRGNLMVRWVGGGGHSMIWETDTHGRVTIRDAQTNKVVFLKEILPYCTLVECVRTDNLELKEGILATVEEN